MLQPRSLRAGRQAAAARRALLLLVVLAALALAGGPRGAAASRPSAALDPQIAPRAGRQLLIPSRQPRVDMSTCEATIANCTQCSFRWKLNTYKLYCVLCDRNYKLIVRSNVCYYDPECGGGTYFDSTVQDCLVCGYGFYCPAATGGITSRFPCVNGTATRSQYARSEMECGALTGYGWVRAGNAVGNVVPCPAGSYNPIRFTRMPPNGTVYLDLPYGCRPCLGNLTTLKPGSNSSQDCVAPAGQFYDVGKATPCPVGSYKPAAGNDDCIFCDDGLLTEGEGSIDPSACQLVVPGYSVSSNGSTAMCTTDGYNPGSQIWGGPGTEIPCSPCPLGTETQEEGATLEDQCLAPPGWGYDNVTKTASICPTGWYGAGWNRLPCKRCGDGISTDGPGAASPDECFVPAGWGSATRGGGVWYAFPCPVNTYGSAAPTPGLQRLDCVPCLDQMLTFNKTECKSDSDCLTQPGYGYYNNAVKFCDQGEWSAGYSRKPCRACAMGYSTAGEGSTSEADCQVAPGWTDDGGADGGVKPCTLGYYKEALGGQPCTACPNGTTTTLYGASALSDCAVCKGGFGAVTIDGTAPYCPLCQPGTFGVAGGLGGCRPCGAGMTSPAGSNDAQDCVSIFVSYNSGTSVNYDYINMASQALTVVASSADITSCMAACLAAAGASDGCQYVEFRGYASAGQQCVLRLGGLAVPGSVETSDRPMVLWMIKPGSYAAYYGHSTDWGSLGDAVTGAIQEHVSWDAATAECDTARGCVGVKFSPTGGSLPWRVFAGSLWENREGHVRVAGAAVNPWVPLPQP